MDRDADQRVVTELRKKGLAVSSVWGLVHAHVSVNWPFRRPAVRLRELRL